MRDERNCFESRSTICTCTVSYKEQNINKEETDTCKSTFALSIRIHLQLELICTLFEEEFKPELRKLWLPPEILSGYVKAVTISSQTPVKGFALWATKDGSCIMRKLHSVCKFTYTSLLFSLNYFCVHPIREQHERTKDNLIKRANPRWLIISSVSAHQIGSNLIFD